MATLVSLKLTSAGRLIERSLVVPQCITLYNLHRVIQYALVPSISDDRVDAMRFLFASGGKAISAAKSTKLKNALSGHGEVRGDTLTYECFDHNVYTLKVMGTAGGDDRFYVPRLTGGFGANINIDKTNKKLLVRRFTPKGAREGGKKKPPKVWCMRGTPAGGIMASHLAAMREPILPDMPEEPRSAAPRPWPQHRSAAVVPVPQIRMAAYGLPPRSAAAVPQPLLQQPGNLAAAPQPLSPQQQQELLQLLANTYCWQPYYWWVPPTPGAAAVPAAGVTTAAAGATAAAAAAGVTAAAAAPADMTAAAAAAAAQRQGANVLGA